MITSLSLALIPYLNFLRRKLSIKMCHFSKYQRFQNFKPRYVLSIKYKSSHSQMFFKISVLTNLANFPEKNLCWSLFLINLQAWRPKHSSAYSFYIFIMGLYWGVIYGRILRYYKNRNLSITFLKQNLNFYILLFFQKIWEICTFL